MTALSMATVLSRLLGMERCGGSDLADVLAWINLGRAGVTSAAARSSPGASS